MGPLRAAIFDVDGRNLLGLFQADMCGRDLPHGKPDREISLPAAKELHTIHADMLVTTLDEVRLDALAGGRLCGTLA